MVDFLESNNNNNWYQSTLIDKKVVTSDGRDQIQIQLGMRIYDEKGDQIEFPSNRRFFGYPTRYDEWVNITSPRIQPKGTVIRGIQTRYKQVESDTYFDDSNDLIYKELYKNKPLFAVTRYHHRSIFLMDLVNQLGVQGFFDKILKRINDRNRHCSIETLVSLIDIINCLNPLLYREFAVDFVPKLKDAVIANILDSPNNNIRNFSKEKIDSAIRYLQELVKRAYSLKDQYEIMETFSLNVAYLCFSSEFLERKLQGLKAVMEIMKEVKYRIRKQEFYLDNDLLFQWVNDKQLFEGLYGKNAHAQLIQRSSDFLKFMLNEDFLTVENLSLIWENLRKGNTEERLAIYKVLNSVSIHLKTHHIDFLVLQISEVSVDLLVKEDLELLYEITKYQNHGIQSLAVYWKGLCELEKVQNEEVAELISQKLCEVLRGWDMEKKRIETLENLVDNIENGVSINASLKVMRKIIDIFNNSPSSMEENTKSSVVELLITKRELMLVLMKDLQRFKDKNKENAGIEEGKGKITNNNGYFAHINEKISFLGFLFNLTPFAFSFGIFNTLWLETVQNSLVEAEKNATYKLFKEILDSKQGKALTLEELKGLFQERLCNSLTWLHSLSPEGFQLFKSILFTINEKESKLVRLSKKPKERTEMYWGTSQYYSITYGANPYSSSSESSVLDYSEFQCKCLPEELLGYDALWETLMSTRNMEVLKETIDLLVNFETSCETQDLRAQRQRFLERIRRILEKGETLHESSLNLLKLLKVYLNQTEQLGIGSIRSHESRLPTEYLLLSFINELTSYSSDCPKRFEQRVPSNLTLWELRGLVAKKLSVSIDQVRLLKAGDLELLDTENGLLLRNLKLKSEETLTVKRRVTQEVPQAPLLTPSEEMNPSLAVIIKELFTRYSTNGLMSKTQCGKFRAVCVGNEKCDGTDQKITELFTTWDDDEDGFLTEKNFLAFYLSACKTSPPSVYRNLESFNYRSDFKTAQDLEKESQISEKALPRYIIGSSEAWFEILFGLLERGGEVGELALELVMRLESWGRILGELRQVESVDWKQVLNSESKPRLLYELQIVEYLMEEGEKEWKLGFIEKGGFEFLYAVFSKLVKNRGENCEKSVVACVLKIFKTYLLSAFANMLPNLHKDVWLIVETRMGLDKIADVLNPKEKKTEGKTAEETSQGLKMSRKKSVEMLENTNKPKNFNENLLSLYQCDIETPIDENPTQKTAEATEAKSPETEKKEIVADYEEKKQDLVVSSDFAEKILHFFDLKVFLDLLLDFIGEILARAEDFELEDRSILEYSLALVFGVVSFDKQLLLEFYLRIESLLLTGLFFEKSGLVRKYVSHFAYVLIAESVKLDNQNNLLRSFLRKLIESLQKPQGKQEREEFYELLCQLLELAMISNDTERKEPEVELSVIFKELVESLYRHQSTEARNGKTTDRVLIGLMKVVRKFLNFQGEFDENTAYRLFNLLLFQPHELDAPVGDYQEEANITQVQTLEIKCKSPESRKVAYDLVLELIKGQQGSTFQLIRQGLGPLLQKASLLLQANNEYFKSTGFNYVPAHNSRSSYGYVGIKNLGCICYMNAMLQQFFMTPAFRYCLLMADDGVPVQNNAILQAEYLRKPVEELFDDNILHQMQRMFSFLEVTDRVEYNPHAFCFAFKDFQGLPVNVSIQQDAQEFLNMIFDKLENGLKATPFKSLLDNVYGGRVCTQLICSECGKKKEREELFYNLSLEVKNLKTLHESLEKYISGEIISDYHCEGCDRRVQTTKRSCLSRFPNVLIIHLQRLVFDLDTLQNEKISSRLEFPMDLDLYNYSYQKIENLECESHKQYQYKLRGVVVHTGTAQYGHYYSYIDIRNDLETRHRGQTFESKWLEFNDTIVRDFDLKNLESECFGGSVDYQDDWGWGTSKSYSSMETSKSAYILIYERELKTPISLNLKANVEGMKLEESLEGMLPEQLITYLDLEKFTQNGTVSLPFPAVRPYVPERFHSVVSKDNAKFMFERLLFSGEFFKFVGQILGIIELPTLTPNIYSLGFEPDFENQPLATRKLQEEMIEILFTLIYDILARANENSSIIEFSSLLKHLLYLHPDTASKMCSLFILKVSQKEYVLTCQDRIVRTYCSSILLHVLNITIAFNKLTLESQGTTDTLDQNVQVFLNDFLGLVRTDLPKNSSKFQQYFEVSSYLLFIFFAYNLIFCFVY